MQPPNEKAVLGRRRRWSTLLALGWFVVRAADVPRPAGGDGGFGSTATRHEPREGRMDDDSS